LIVYMHHLVPDIVTLLEDRSAHKCAEQSPKESDDIRNQMMHIYNQVLLMMSIIVLETCRGIR